MFVRRLLRHQRWILSLAAVLFLVAQLGVATHPLHLDSSVTKADVACAFCATSHGSMDTPLHATVRIVSAGLVQVASEPELAIRSFSYPSSARPRAPPYY
jgi:hypothetical protein